MNHRTPTTNERSNHPYSRRKRKAVVPEVRGRRSEVRGKSGAQGCID
jgi:hypothetical protein